MTPAEARALTMLEYAAFERFAKRVIRARNKAASKR